MSNKEEGVKMSNKEETEQILKEAEEYFKDKKTMEVDILINVDTLPILEDKLKRSGIVCVAVSFPMTEAQKNMVRSAGESLKEFMFLKIVVAETDASNIINFLKNTGLPTARTAKAKAMEEFYDPNNKGSVQ